ncbi:MAG: hypothetical protein R3F34_18335 [Planctomycetota bacterium]
MNDGAGDPAATEPRPKPEGLLGSLFTFLAIGLVGATVIAVLGLRLQGGDVRALYDELLPDHATALPLGLEYTGGTALAGDQRWVLLDREGEEREDLPTRVAIARYKSVGESRRLFQPDVRENNPRDLGMELEKWKKEPYRFEATTRRGVVVFGAHETDWIQARHFQADGTFFDVIRVDLSVGMTGQVLFANFEAGYEGAKVEVLVPLLEQLHLAEAGK